MLFYLVSLFFYLVSLFEDVYKVVRHFASQSVIAHWWSTYTRQACPQVEWKIRLRQPNLGFPLNWQGWQIPPNVEMPSTWNVARLCSKIIEISSQAAGSLRAVFFPFFNLSLHKMFYLVSEKSKKLFVSLKIQIVNEMCNQGNNGRSGDSTREIYSLINNWPDSSRFKFALIN